MRFRRLVPVLIVAAVLSTAAQLEAQTCNPQVDPTCSNPCDPTTDSSCVVLCDPQTDPSCGTCDPNYDPNCGNGGSVEALKCGGRLRDWRNCYFRCRENLDVAIDDCEILDWLGWGTICYAHAAHEFQNCASACVIEFCS